MKIDTHHNSVALSDDFKSMDFGIRSCDMGIILETLRSKMYKNPIGAVCREIASNSRDANREVGKSKIPVRIQIDKDLFNPGETTISFIDDGPGIDEERMAEIFVNYGSSTKRGTNRLTGGFGFGSKTPFAYSDSFSVVTKVNGMKYTYVAAIEENNTGKIYLFNKIETSEPNGTTIVIPIKKNDIETFESECLKATWFWEPRPQYINFHFYPDVKMDVTPYNDELFVKQDDHQLYPEYYYLLIDGIPYEISDGDLLKLPRVHDYKKAFFLVFKTGQLTISANRESVQYDSHTIKTIKLKYEKMWKQFKDDIQTKIESCPNQFEACLIIQEHINHPLFDHLTELKEAKFTYKGQPIDPLFQFTKIKISRVTVDGKTICNRAQVGMRDGIYFVETILSPGRTKSLLQKATIQDDPSNDILNQSNLKKGFFVVEMPKEVRGFQKKTFSEKRKVARTMRCVLSEFSFLKNMEVKLLRYSDITPTKVKIAQEEIKENRIFIKAESGSVYGQWKKLENIKKDSIYVVPDKNYESQKQWINFIHQVFKINVITISKQYEKYLIGKFQTLKDYIKNVDKSKLQVYSDYKFIESSEGKKSCSLLKKLNVPELSEWDIRLITAVKEKGYNRYYTIPSDFYTIVPASQDIKVATDKLEKTFKKYPLLLEYNEYSSSTKHWQEYINAINVLKQGVENVQ